MIESKVSVQTYPHEQTLRTDDIVADLNIGDEFIRPIIHGIPKRLRDETQADLERSLEAIDEHFAFIAATVGASVLPHEWLLVDDSDLRTKSGSYAHTNGLELFGLPDIWLAAKVNKIDGLSYKEALPLMQFGQTAKFNRNIKMVG